MPTWHRQLKSHLVTCMPLPFPPLTPQLALGSFRTTAEPRARWWLLLRRFESLLAANHSDETPTTSAGLCIQPWSSWEGGEQG